MDLHRLPILKFKTADCESVKFNSNTINKKEVDKQNRIPTTTVPAANISAVCEETIFPKSNNKHKKNKPKSIFKLKHKSDPINDSSQSKPKKRISNKEFCSLNYILHSLGSKIFSSEIKNEHRKKPKRSQPIQVNDKDCSKDVQILFVNEISKSKKKVLKSKMKRRNRRKEISKPSGYVEPTVHCHCETVNISSNMKKSLQKLITPKKRFPLKGTTTTSVNYLITKNSKKLRRTKSTSSNCDCRVPMRCNVVDFPECNRKLKNRGSYPLYGNRNFQCNNQQVSIDSMPLPIIEKTIGEAAVGTSRTVCSRKIQSVIQSAPNHSKLCKNQSRPETVKKVPAKLYPQPPDVCNFQSKVKEYAKYLLFAVVIVLWFPCIILIAVCWLITDSFRRSSINKGSTASKKNCTPSSKPKKNMLSSFLNCICRAIDRAVYSGKIVASLFQMNERKTDVTRPKRCGGNKAHLTFTQYPNPNKTYTLSFAKKKGWIIKPIYKERKKKSNFQQVFYELCSCHGVRPCDFVEKSVQKHKSQKNTNVKHLDCDCSYSPSKRVTINDSRKPLYLNAHPEYTQCNIRSPVVEKQSCRDNKIHHQHPNVTKTFSGSNQRTSPDFTRVSPPKYLQISHHRNPALSHSDPLTNKFISSLCPAPPFKSRSTPQTKQCSVNKYDSHKFSGQSVNCITPPRTKRHPCKQSHSKTFIVNNKVCNYKRHHQPRNVSSCQAFNSKSVGVMKICPSRECGKKNKSFVKKVLKRFKGFVRVLTCAIEVADRKMWSHFKNDMYEYTLRRRPCFWIYRCCPSAYPCFLTWHNFCRSFCHTICLILSMFLWCPIVCCSYICCKFLCKYSFF